MHVIRRTKAEKPQPFIPTVSTFAIPGHRRTANRRYDSTGKFIGMSKPAPVIDAATQAAVKAAFAAAAKLKLPQETGPFDLNRYTPLPHRILVTRGALIKEENGVALPEDAWHYKKEFIVVRVGDGVTACGIGDRVIFGKGFRPAEVHIGTAKLYIGREQAVVGIMESN